MKIILMLSLLALVIPSAQDVASTSSFIILKDIEAEYGSFDEITPALVNDSDKSIYLLTEDCGEAQVMRFNEILNKWVAGVAASCPDRDDAIEIKSGESHRVSHVGWRIAKDKYGKAIETNSVAGRYRLIMRYSLKSSKEKGWKPELKYKVIASPEFRIVQ